MRPSVGNLRVSARLMTLIGAAALALIVPATIIPALLSERDRQIERYALWSVPGPPCPLAIAPPAPGRTRTLVVEGVAFSRRVGHIACTVLKSNEGRGFSSMPTCQFTSPGALTVTTGRGPYAFDIPPGMPALVIVHAGHPECRLAADRTLFSPSNDRPWS